jgi:heme exporter protein A
MKVTISDLSVARGGVTVLAGLTCGVAPGEALVLTGPNGVGKTSLLRTLAHLQPPAGGKFDLDPEALIYAAHADAVKPTLTVGETLDFWAAIYGTRTAGVAARMNLGHLSDRRGAELSAGQRRRLGLARLLVAARPVWLLDEPTVSLDTGSTALFAGLIADHLAAGNCALIASHLDLGLSQARRLDLQPYRDRARASPAFHGHAG